MTNNKNIFLEELNQIESEIARIRKLDSVNSELQKYNWIFLHPFSQGGDIDYLSEILANESLDHEKIIKEFFARKFLDLDWTISFLYGFHATRPFLKDYISTIEESVVLCFQKDFRGAICALIPVIEGSLRKYLISKKGVGKSNEIQIKELMKSLSLICSDYLALEKKFLRLRHLDSLISNEYMDANQENRLMKKNKEYIDLWLKQIEVFLTNNLYLNTKNHVVSDNLNRHVIFHGFEDKIDFSFSNYLRIFNTINFFSWAFGIISEECSVFCEVKDDVFRDKKSAFINILSASEALTETKKIIYENEIENFFNYLTPNTKLAIKRKVKLMKAALNSRR